MNWTEMISFSDTFENMHFGNFTFGIDERGEVAMLSRSILIEGVIEPECYITDSKDQLMCDTFGYDTFGGHVKVVALFFFLVAFPFVNAGAQ
jgi:hypothetical protein